jgi:uncharacterized protein
MAAFQLVMRGANDVEQIMVYDPITSEMYWEETSDKPDLKVISPNLEYNVNLKVWKPAPITNPSSEETHGKKSKNVKILKITMGLKCNFACSYCNQAHQPHDPVGGPEDAEELVQKIRTNFNISKYDKVRIEFWGGEPMVYWKTLKPLAERIRDFFPNASFNMVTNGSMLDKEKVTWLNDLGFSIGISHDGPLHAKNRGPDPLDDPKMREGIITAVQVMGQGRVGFNAVLTNENVSLVAVRDFIWDKVKPEISQGQIHVTTEELMLPYDDSGMQHSLRNRDEQKEILHALFWETIKGDNHFSMTIHSKLKSFFEGLAQGRPANTIGQKCGMDRDDNIAIDMKGNVTTCQNTSSLTKHNLGNIEDFDNIRLHTSYHWSTRAECPSCPVVQLCQGACLFLENQYWEQACENLFWYNTAMLAAAMFFITDGLILTEIRGEKIRRDGITSVPLIDIDFVKSNGTKRSWKVRKPVNIPVVAA